MVSIDAINDALHLNVESLCEGTAPRDRNSKGHRICILPHFDIVEKTLATRLQFVVNNDGFVCLSNAYSRRSIVKRIDSEGPEACWCRLRDLRRHFSLVGGTRTRESRLRRLMW